MALLQQPLLAAGAPDELEREPAGGDELGDGGLREAVGDLQRAAALPELLQPVREAVDPRARLVGMAREQVAVLAAGRDRGVGGERLEHRALEPVRLGQGLDYLLLRGHTGSRTRRPPQGFAPDMATPGQMARRHPVPGRALRLCRTRCFPPKGTNESPVLRQP